MKPSSSSWRNLIWREWLHTEDVQYAAQLYELVADKPPVAWPTIIVMAGLAMSLGALLGLFLWVLVNWTVGIGSLSESFNWNVVSYYIIGVGGVTCLLFCLFTWFAFSWRYSWATFFTGVRAG